MEESYKEENPSEKLKPEMAETQESSSESSLSSVRKNSPDKKSPSERLLIQAMLHSGPIPAPEVLKGYDLVRPGLSDQIVEMAKKQQDHRLELERATILGGGKRAWAGLVLGFILSSATLCGSVYLIANGHDPAGATLGTASIAALAGVFVYGSQQRKEERTEKQEELLNRLSFKNQKQLSE